MAVIVGKTAPVGQRMGYEVYEAREHHECAWCEGTIAPGEHFTRRTMTGGGSRRWPVCSECADASASAPGERKQ